MISILFKRNTSYSSFIKIYTAVKKSVEKYIIKI